jgi:hypothetical protein
MNVATMLRDALPLRAELGDDADIGAMLDIWQAGYLHAMTLADAWRP